MPEEEPSARDQVRRQYEDYPYPERDPEDEGTRLVRTLLENLDRMNFYCFRGRRDFHDSFRALVAGGGTGDATIFLAEQLKGTNASVVYLDFSGNSMEIARRRAEVRGLENITWIRGSLLELPDMGLDAFDYISCTGVLHHLEEPESALAALQAVLKDDGAMGLMVYAKYGRTGVYQMQELMRLINRGENDKQVKVRNTRQVLAALPETNWFKRGEDLIAEHQHGSDAEIYDLFLHSTDRPYTIRDVHELLDSAGLSLVEFVAVSRALYRPELVLRSPQILSSVRELPVRKQQAVAEIGAGTIIKHEFYAAAGTDTIASLDDPDNIVFFAPHTRHGEHLYELMEARPGQRLLIDTPQKVKLEIQPRTYTKYFFKYIDGRRTIREMLELTRNQSATHPSDEEILADWRPTYEAMVFVGLLLLRHASLCQS